MKLGDKVAVCHDGKWGRRVAGTVVATKNGHHIKVAFPHPSDGNTVEFWVKKTSTVHYRLTKEIDELSSIVYLKNYSHFAGWADIDWFCPWYSVYKWKE